ncbi:MAG: hypothetical protein GF334_01045 [Candidatus Altiarchaeales archaeon]|nr:hypothetical protein [Candidatus Altiarchaeales archaeon]
MGEEVEILKLLKDHNHAEGRQRKQHNKESSTEILTKSGVNFTARNNGTHLIVEEGGKIVDYWPSTGLFIDRADKKRRRGVFRLLKHVGKKMGGINGRAS